MSIARHIEIEVRGLCKRFGEHVVLDAIDVDVYQGEVIAIVGGSGCGKTVFINHILGQLQPDAGTIRVVNHDLPDAPLVALNEVSEMDIDNIHKHWGVVFQRNALFSGTVYENIALWLKEVKSLADSAIVPIVRNALRSVGLNHDDAFLATPQEKLSGGMAKRLAVARALAMEPYVIFYDEPTTGLDPVSSAQIHNLIHATHYAMNERTSLVITHDKDLLTRLRPRTIMLHDGHVHFDGPFVEFEASDSEIIRPYFDLMPVLHARLRE